MREPSLVICPTEKGVDYLTKYYHNLEDVKHSKLMFLLLTLEQNSIIIENDSGFDNWMNEINNSNLRNYGADEISKDILLEAIENNLVGFKVNIWE